MNGRTDGHDVVDYAEQRNLHLSDAMATWLLDNGIASSMRTAEWPLDEAAVCELIRDPLTVTGASDAGAHIQMFSGAGNSTYLFTRYVRDAGLLSIEEAVHAVTGKHASFFGLNDRGVLEVGKAADIVVFALDESSRADVRSTIPGQLAYPFPCRLSRNLATGARPPPAARPAPARPEFAHGLLPGRRRAAAGQPGRPEYCSTWRVPQREGCEPTGAAIVPPSATIDAHHEGTGSLARTAPPRRVTADA